MKKKWTLSTKQLALVSALGLVLFFILNMSSAQDEAMNAETLFPAITKEQAGERAQQFIAAGLQQETKVKLVIMQVYKNFNAYLQKEKLMASYRKEAANHYPYDFYQVELVPTKDDGSASPQTRYLVDVHQNSGEVIGWQRFAPTTAPSDLSQAEEAAYTFALNRGYDKHDLQTISVTNDGTVTLGHKQQIGEAQLQLQLVIDDRYQVVSYVPSFIIPASHLAWMLAQDTRSSKLEIVSLLGNVLLLISVLLCAIIYRRSISYSRGILLTLIFIVLSTMYNFSMYPAYMSGVITQDDREFTVQFYLIFTTIVNFIMAAMVYLTLVAGEGMWRTMDEDLWSRWRKPDYSRHILRAMGIGYLFCIIILAVQQLIFFIGAKYFDVWSVADPMFSTTNLLYPALYPLLAWVAAISEEAIYRLFGIALLRKLFRSTIIASILSSMIWALGHISYPIYPPYTRFVEVTILGLIFAYILLKYGFITAVFAHGAFDSLLMGLSLMYDGKGLHIVLGLFYIILPALIGFVLYGLHRVFKRPQVPTMIPPASG